MNFKAFKSMWEADGFNLIEHSKKAIDGITWMLFAAYSDDRREDYGRHMGITLALKGDEIVSHALINITDTTNLTREMMEWFDKTVAGGIVE